MKITRLCLFVSLLLAPLYSAHAVVFSEIGQGVNVTYNGIVDGNGIESLSAQTSFLLQSIEDDGRTWVFEGSVANISSTDSRVSILGFDTSQFVDLSASAATGAFSNVSSGKSPQGINSDYCLKSTGGKNCAGGGGGGTGIGTSDAFTFTISLTESTSSLELSDFIIRYQSIEGIEYGSSGVGTATAISPFVSQVPIPAAGILFFSGLLSLGLLRRAFGKR